MNLKYIKLKKLKLMEKITSTSKFNSIKKNLLNKIFNLYLLNLLNVQHKYEKKIIWFKL